MNETSLLFLLFLLFVVCFVNKFLSLASSKTYVQPPTFSWVGLLAEK